MRVAIIGGGISGLTAAYELVRRGGFEITLLEASSRCGGLIRSERVDGYLLEGGPDSFLASKPEAIELCRQLGLESRLASMRTQARRAFVWFRGRPYQLPAGFLNPPLARQDLLEIALLSPEGRARALDEPSIPRGAGGEESVGQFYRRRFGGEVVDRVIDPLIGGVFGARADEVSLSSAFGRILRFEQAHGCLISPDAKRDAGGEESTFLTLREGMQGLTDALLGEVQDGVNIETSKPASAVLSGDGEFRISVGEGTLATDVVVLATSAPTAAKLLEADYKRCAKALSKIIYNPAVVLCMGFEGSLTSALPGAGLLIPPSEGKRLLACSWVDKKFPGRTPPGGALIRAYAAGPQAAGMLELDSGEIAGRIRSELSEVTGIRATPIVQRLYRLPRSLPIYGLGHSSLIDALQSELADCPGLHCIGNYLDGVGISDCIRHARQAVAHICRRQMDLGPQR